VNFPRHIHTNMGTTPAEWWGTPHTVEASCSCPDVENCRMERYLSDIRLLELELSVARLALLRAGIENPAA
jgi:hypothetical protein